jgi:hypothetical protein
LDKIIHPNKKIKIKIEKDGLREKKERDFYIFPRT